MRHVGAWYMRCGNVVLSSIGVSIALIVVAQYTINVVLVLRPSFTVTNLSQPAAPVTAAAASPSLHDHRRSWTLAQLPSVFRRRVLEYFNPGTIPAPTERPRPLCPLPVLRTRNRRHGLRQAEGSGDVDAERHVGGDEGEAPVMGGSWRPINCTSRHRIAVVVPYRDRRRHLRVFLRYMHPFLQRQMLDYTVYVVEQTSASRFNRGMLLNIGFTEASRRRDHECYFFHDVDLLPENDSNLYSCPDQPRHASSAVNTMSYQLLYRNMFGGVEAFRRDHFQLVNGFSNKYFGWGGEDDDLAQRVLLRRLNLTRYSQNVARYTMLSHNESARNPQRGVLLKTGPERMENDGLNSLRYEIKAFEKRPLYTRILVHIDEHAVLNSDPTKDA